LELEGCQQAKLGDVPPSSLLILAIVAVVEKATVLAETPIGLDSIDHHPRFDNNLIVDSGIGLGNKACI
jgi:hypothetical protein